MELRKKPALKFGATPSVDLLPSGQRAELLHERVMRRLLVAIVACAAVAGLIAAAGLVPERIADDRLRAAEERSQQLLQQIAAQAETQAAISDSAKLGNARKQLTEREVLFASLADEVAALLPSGMTVTSFQGSLPADGAEGEQQGGTLCQGEAANLTVVASASDLTESPNYTERLEGVTGVLCIVATQIERDENAGMSNVTLQLGLSDEALAHRFTEEAE